MCILAYVSLILIASFILGRDYRSETQEMYHSSKDADVYEITSKQFIPAVQVFRYSLTESPYVFMNEDSLYDMYYLQSTTGETDEPSDEEAGG